MSKKFKDFDDFLNEQEGQEGVENPQKEQAADTAPLRGYKADQIITRIEEMMEIMPDEIRFGVPSDTYGHSTTYRDANGAIEKIRDMQHYYESKGEEIRFYCWNINYSGSWEATKSLRQKIQDFGGFGKFSQNMNLRKVIDYFTQNPEDVDNVRSISISMDSKSIRAFAKRMSSGEEGSLD